MLYQTAFMIKIQAWRAILQQVARVAREIAGNLSVLRLRCLIVGRLSIAEDHRILHRHFAEDV